MRALQFIEPWKRLGAKIILLKRIKNKSFFSIVFFYIKLLKQAYFSDILFIQKPNLHPLIFQLLKYTGVKVVIDIDDAVWEDSSFSQTKESQKGASRIGNHFFKAAISANLVICGSKYLEKFIHQKIKGVKTIVIPPTVDSNIPIKKNFLIKKPIVGWIGSESNLKDLSLYREILKELVESGQIEFLIISNSIPEEFSNWSRFIPWSLKSEIKDLSIIDIGIMPLRDDPRSKGRCGYKAIQYMNLGIPVITNEVGSSCEIIKNRKNGFFINSSDDLEKLIQELTNDLTLKAEMIKNAKETVCENHDLETNAKIILNSFKDLL